MDRREPNRGGSVASNGFGENVCSIQPRQLFADGGGLLVVGDDPEMRSREDRREALDGLFEHGLAADDIEQLLWRARAAARPEARAASSGENDGVSGHAGDLHGCTRRDHTDSSTR